MQYSLNQNTIKPTEEIIQEYFPIILEAITSLLHQMLKASLATVLFIITGFRT